MLSANIFRCIVARSEIRTSAPHGDDSIFDTQKAFESRRQAACKFLPREDLTSGPKIGGLNTSHHSVPLFEQVWPPCVEQDAKMQIECMRCQNISHQLIRQVI
jgi:hypothetical protein